MQVGLHIKYRNNALLPERIGSSVILSFFILLGGNQMKKHIKRAVSGLLASAMLMQAGAAIAGQTASAEDLQRLYGDLNQDAQLTAVDLTLMKRGLMDSSTLDVVQTAIFDVSANGVPDIADAVLMSQYLTTQIDSFPSGWLCTIPEEHPDDNPNDNPDDNPNDNPDTDSFLAAGIAEHGASLPTAGEANLVIFYVDFPDCRYDYAPSEEELNRIAFGAADESKACYPFESFTAFYGRASKGNMQLRGQAFRYTTKENQAAYDTNKVKIAEECYDAFKDSVDFSQFDGDGDGKIDATLFTTPTAAGDDNWWPCAGAFGDPSYRVDGKAIGHIITGNAQIYPNNNYLNFISSYCHEMGHCTGLPDYYLYNGYDSEGMHGTAGIELMDTDAGSDFGAFSKLMLGFYRENQVQVYDASAGAQTFTLHNAQTDAGNCVIIPYGKIGDHYFSEYFIIEYASLDGNNSGVSDVAWWVRTGSGVRVYHIDATTEYGWFTFFRYASGSEFSDQDRGRRLIRIIDDTDTDNFYHAGDTIDSSISGFRWYDDNARQTIDPGVKITIDSFENDTYTITVSPN